MSSWNRRARIGENMALIKESSVPIELDHGHRRAVLGGEPLVFHCHHYNTFLQRSIRDLSFIDSVPFLVGAANEVAFHQLSRWFEGRGVSGIPERKEAAEELYRWAGFGRVSLAALTEAGGTVETPLSHYSHAWLSKFGMTDSPVDFFTTGWLTGALAAVYETPQAHFDGRQTSCMATGETSNRFEITIAGEPAYSCFESPGCGPLTEHALRPSPESEVDDEGIYRALTSMEIAGDDRGAIPAFGVSLTRHYATSSTSATWNRSPS